MKKVIIPIALLLSGALLLKPVTTTSFAKDKNEESAKVSVEATVNTVESLNENIDKIQLKEEPKEQVKEDQVIQKEEVKAEDVKVEEVTQPSEEEVVAIEDKEEVIDIAITKSEAQEILNRYINEVEQGDFTYTYQGDENNFDTLKEDGIKGYVFLPNIETDMGYLVDKDNGSIYLFHPSGYLELVK